MNKWKYEINIKQHLIADGDFADRKRIWLGL